MTAETQSKPGSSWSNPIRYRGYRIYQNDILTQLKEFDWFFSHEDYDGAEDSKDGRYGSGASVEECMKEINAQLDD